MQLNRKFYSTTWGDTPLAVVYVDGPAQYWSRFYKNWSRPGCPPGIGSYSTLKHVVPDTLALLITGPLIAIENLRNGEIA